MARRVIRQSAERCPDVDSLKAWIRGNVIRTRGGATLAAVREANDSPTMRRLRSLGRAPKESASSASRSRVTWAPSFASSGQSAERCPRLQRSRRQYPTRRGSWWSAKSTAVSRGGRRRISGAGLTAMPPPVTTWEASPWIRSSVDVALVRRSQKRASNGSGSARVTPGTSSTSRIERRLPCTSGGTLRRSRAGNGSTPLPPPAVSAFSCTHSTDDRAANRADRRTNRATQQ